MMKLKTILATTALATLIAVPALAQQITVKAGNGQVVTIAGEIALLRYRVENLEADKRLPRQQPMTGGRQ